MDQMQNNPCSISKLLYSLYLLVMNFYIHPN